MQYTRSQRFALVFVPPVAAALIRMLGATLRYEDRAAAGVEVDYALRGPSVFAFWHCSLLACAHRFHGKEIAVLISRSFDGELIARTVERLGFTAVRGSSSHGGAVALKYLAEAYAAGRHCAITADGPRGPARVAKPGVAQLAQLVGAEWVGTFYAQADRAWVLKTWDGFRIPKPFSRVVIGWPAHVAAGGSVGDLQAAVQASLAEAVTLAEVRGAAAS